MLQPRAIPIGARGVLFDLGFRVARVWVTVTVVVLALSGTSRRGPGDGERFEKRPTCRAGRRTPSEEEGRRPGAEAAIRRAPVPPISDSDARGQDRLMRIALEELIFDADLEVIQAVMDGSPLAEAGPPPSTERP
jgi:hypothetical protein